MIYEGYVFRGGGYKHQDLIELIEDVGGVIVNARIMGNEATITFVFPKRDVSIIEDMILSRLRGEFDKLPLVGSEIAVVLPSITRHHFPHPACDISEYLRRKGAKTNIIGLARGVGRRITQISQRERRVIEEHDIAVLILGNFRDCIERYKWKLYDNLQIPVVVIGGPEEVDSKVPYIGGFGRVLHRLKSTEEIRKLDELVAALERCLGERQENLTVSPFAIKSEIENQVDEIKRCLSPSPIVVQCDGVRIKINYDKYASKIRESKIGDRRVRDVAEVKRSEIKDYIIVKPYLQYV
jgi:putative methanogenesis marker protein 7